MNIKKVKYDLTDIYRRLKIGFFCPGKDLYPLMLCKTDINSFCVFNNLFWSAFFWHIKAPFSMYYSIIYSYFQVYKKTQKNTKNKIKNPGWVVKNTKDIHHYYLLLLLLNNSRSKKNKAVLWLCSVDFYKCGKFTPGIITWDAPYKPISLKSPRKLQ